MALVQTEHDHIHQLFAARGLRCTRQRRAIYETLATSRRHPTADQIHRDVAEKMQGLSLATVYNTLEAFCRAGLAQRIMGDHGSSRYDTTEREHLHLRCERSGTVHDVPDPIGRRLLDAIPPSVINDIETKLGFKVHHIQIELVGQMQRRSAGRTPPAPNNPHA